MHTINHIKNKFELRNFDLEKYTLIILFKNLCVLCTRMQPYNSFWSCRATISWDYLPFCLYLSLAIFSIYFHLWKLRWYTQSHFGDTGNDSKMKAENNPAFITCKNESCNVLLPSTLFHVANIFPLPSRWFRKKSVENQLRDYYHSWNVYIHVQQIKCTWEKERESLMEHFGLFFDHLLNRFLKTGFVGRCWFAPTKR